MGKTGGKNKGKRRHAKRSQETRIADKEEEPRRAAEGTREEGAEESALVQHLCPKNFTQAKKRR